MKTIKVKVTLGHIVMGKPGEADKCMVALAVKDVLLNSVLRVNVSHKYLCIVDRYRHLLTAAIPKHVTSRIRQFDAGKPVSPFEFTIDIP